MHPMIVFASSCQTLVAIVRFIVNYNPLGLISRSFRKLAESWKCYKIKNNHCSPVNILPSSGFWGPFWSCSDDVMNSINMAQQPIAASVVLCHEWCMWHHQCRTTVGAGVSIGYFFIILEHFQLLGSVPKFLEYPFHVSLSSYAVCVIFSFLLYILRKADKIPQKCNCLKLSFSIS